MAAPTSEAETLKFDDRNLMRFGPDYATALPGPAALDWSEHGGFGQAVEMCNNNGTCRKLSGGAMCPSYRATKDETHVTRGRANALRLAISGQLGPEAFTSAEMKEAMDLCVGCKACQRECPTGVDMAKMKVEFLHHYHARHGRSLKDMLIAHLPRYAAAASLAAPLMNLRDKLPGLAALSEKLLASPQGVRFPPGANPGARPARSPIRRTSSATAATSSSWRHIQPRLRAGEP